MYKKGKSCRELRLPTNNRLQLRLLVGAAHRALDETIGVRLGGVHLGILAGVLGTFVPAEVYEAH